MQTRTIYDSKGVWLVNTGAFPFVDPETGARFEPRVPTKAQKTDWVKSQPVMTDWVDPDEATQPDKDVEVGKTDTTKTETSKS